MRAGPSLDDINGWNKIEPLVDYGKDGRFNVRSVKLFMDGEFRGALVARRLKRSVGALGSWGASLLAPYSDNNSTSGLLIIEPEEMRKKLERAWRYGWQVVRTDVDTSLLDLKFPVVRTYTRSGTGPTRLYWIFSRIWSRENPDL